MNDVYKKQIWTKYDFIIDDTKKPPFRWLLNYLTSNMEGCLEPPVFPLLLVPPDVGDRLGF